MGRYKDLDSDQAPSPSPVPTPLGESASAISLQSTSANPPMSRYFDDDPTELDSDDLPPLYSDVGHGEDDDDDETVPFSRPTNPLAPASSSLPGDLRPFKTDEASGTTYYLSRHLYSEAALDPSFLEADAELLEKQVRTLAAIAPRPYVHLRGTHYENVEKRQSGANSGSKTTREEVVDFDIEVDLTTLLFEDIRAGRSWRELRTVGNFEKVRRGTIFTTRAPGFGGSGSVPEAGQPGVTEWCHRFIASNAGLKALTLERKVTGWDWNFLRRQLEDLTRNSTGYRGQLKVEFPVRNAKVEMYNDCLTNRWRLTRWIELLFMLSLLFIFVWPWLFLRTRRWETIYAEWPLSVMEDPAEGEDEEGLNELQRRRRQRERQRRKYVSMSEERWYNTWGRAIQKAMLDRRQGVLDQGDLARADGALPENMPRGSSRVLSAAVRTGMDAMGVVDQSFGWGGDRW